MILCLKRHLVDPAKYEMFSDVLWSVIFKKKVEKCKEIQQTFPYKIIILSKKLRTPKLQKVLSIFDRLSFLY